MAPNLWPIILLLLLLLLLPLLLLLLLPLLVGLYKNACISSPSKLLYLINSGSTNFLSGILPNRDSVSLSTFLLSISITYMLDGDVGVAIITPILLPSGDIFKSPITPLFFDISDISCISPSRVFLI